jgi:mannosyltransferase
MRGRHLHALIALVAFGALLRFATLDARGLWIDEVYTVARVEIGLGGLVSEFVSEGYRSAPLYFLVAWLWAKLFGTGEIALRSLTALLGTATIPVAYWAVRELATRRAALVAAALATVSPLLVWTSQDARPYSLLVLLGGLSFLFFARSLKTGSGTAVAAWAASSVLAVATHYLAFFPVAAEAIWLLTARGRPRQALIGLVAVVAVPAAMFAARGGETPNPTFVSDIDFGSRLVQIPAQFLVGYQPPYQIASSVAAFALALVAVWLLVRRGDERERSAALLGVTVGTATVLGPVLLKLIGFDYVLTRYLTAGWIAVASVAAIGFAVRRAGRAGPAAAAALCALFVAIDIGSAWEPKFDREDWRGAAAALGPRVPGRAVVVSPGIGAEVVRYYRPGTVTKGLPEYARLRAIVLVGLAPRYRRIGRTPKPPRPATVPPPWPGFELAGRRDAEHFTIVRFTAARRRTVRLPLLADSSLDGRGRVVIDRY